MFTINGNKEITLSRGDSVSFSLYINKGTPYKAIRYILTDYDEIEFYLVPINQPFENNVLYKKFTKDDLNEDGDVVIKLDYTDTKDLPEKEYRYLVRLKTNKQDGEYEFNTIIVYTPFFLIGASN